ncbi:hypothetical protein LJK88_01050 [Paenibacillus sp. P26]|nr:hypothetical protein LJK88_01050 [Paenibacillus sp. P26]UUZ91159.1 hypothetical protein LJK87_36395 [Paenibacillus sp. P25]
MSVWLKILLTAVIILGFLSFVWFLLGSTAFFQRFWDVTGTTVLVSVGIPVLVLTTLFTILLIKRWTPNSGLAYAGLFIGLVSLTILSASLILSVNTYGWMQERVLSDTLKITADKKYEYRIELINLFQRNSHAQLYLKNISTGDEMNIPIEIQTKQIVGLGTKKYNNWVVLEPSVGAERYTLYTTKELGIPEEKFEINIIAKTSSRLN